MWSKLNILVYNLDLGLTTSNINNAIILFIMIVFYITVSMGAVNPMMILP